VNVRIVAATNADLEGEVTAGRFRADLFHRLNQVRITIPPLRERLDDIPPLARLFLEQQKPGLTISDEAVAALQMYSWPGNIRELKSLMARLAVLSTSDEIRLEDMPQEFQNRMQSSTGPTHSIEKLEQELIFEALTQAAGRRDRAAEMLGISRRTLMRRL